LKSPASARPSWSAMVGSSSSRSARSGRITPMRKT